MRSEAGGRPGSRPAAPPDHPRPLVEADSDFPGHYQVPTAFALETRKVARIRRIVAVGADRGAGMDLMPTVSHVASYCSAAVSVVGGIVAQVSVEPDVAKGGLVIGATGLAGLIILVLREFSTPLLTFAKLLADNRTERIRNQETIRQLAEQLEASHEETKALKLDMAAVVTKANESENLAIQLQARQAEMERQSSMRIARVERKSDVNATRLTAIEQGASGDDIPRATGGADDA